jgi:hypothetical protein
MRSARRHLSYANVVATLALVLAMGGGALAATHYLITSTKQISPHVLSQLRGRRGPAGKTGKRGPQGKPGGPRGPRGREGPIGVPGLMGVQGVEGPEGHKGVRGEKGDPGASAYAPLPPGQSESGLYSVNVGASPAKVEFDSISFPVVLGSSLPRSNIEFVPAGAAKPHCEKVGSAARGYLCIYSNFNFGAEEGILPEPVFLNIEALKPEEGSGAHGFVMEWGEPAKGAHDLGTYTFTEK